MGLLANKRAVVVGIANKRSIAWGIAKALDREGADLVMTYQTERFRENLDALAEELTKPPVILGLDVAEEASRFAFADALKDRYDQGGIDVLVHSIANAHRQDLEGRFVETSREGFLHALEVSAYSLPLLTRALLPWFEKAGGGSVITMTYHGSERVMPNYNVMGVAKAALESSVRYLAYDLGRDHIRVNAISAGPVKTLAMAGVKGGGSALHEVAARAPIPENISIDDVGNAAVFLASDWARMITGHVLFVDSGSHVMGA